MLQYKMAESLVPKRMAAKVQCCGGGGGGGGRQHGLVVRAADL